MPRKAKRKSPKPLPDTSSTPPVAPETTPTKVGVTFDNNDGRFDPLVTLEIQQPVVMTPETARDLALKIMTSAAVADLVSLSVAEQRGQVSVMFETMGDEQFEKISGGLPPEAYTQSLNAMLLDLLHRAYLKAF